MKNLVTALITAMLALFLVFALPTSGEEVVYENTLRLHVLAASDAIEDQTAKLLVRDALLEDHGEAFLACATKEDAEEYLSLHLSSIERTVENTLVENNLDYSFTVTLTDEYFDTRMYEEVTLPAGNYTALKITLGEGKGQNFWCMLYPALCVAPALGEEITAEDAYEDATYELVTNGYAVRFRTLEIFSSFFN